MKMEWLDLYIVATNRLHLCVQFPYQISQVGMGDVLEDTKESHQRVWFMGYDHWLH